MGGNGYHLAELALFNKGSDVIPAKRWEMYAYIFHIVEPYSYPYPRGFYFRDGGLKVSHIGGNLYRFEPVGGYFREIKPGEGIHFKLKMTHFQVSKTDSFPRWYVSAFDRYPRIIGSTDGEYLEFIGPLVRENQVKRRVDDTFHPLSASERYKIYRSQRGPNISKKINVLPSPLYFEVDNDVLIEWEPRAWFILKPTHFKAEANYFNSMFSYISYALVKGSLMHHPHPLYQARQNPIMDP